MEKFKEIKETFITILCKPEMQILPGQVAFYLLMSIIPIVAITALVASYITANFNILEALSGVVPGVLLDILDSLSGNVHFEGLLVILFLYILLGSNAPGSIIVASNMLYNIKQPNYLKLKVKSFVMTMMIIILLLFVLLIPLFGDLIIKTILQAFQSADSLYQYKWIYQIIKAIISCIIMFIIIKVLYTMAPSNKIPSKSTTLGAIFTTISWIVVTEVFSFYITNIASYDVIYGNFANVLILLIWVYLLAYFFVIGMAINVNKFKKLGKCVNEKEKKVKRENKKQS